MKYWKSEEGGLEDIQNMQALSGKAGDQTFAWNSGRFSECTSSTPRVRILFWNSPKLSSLLYSAMYGTGLCRYMQLRRYAYPAFYRNHVDLHEMDV